MTTSEIVSAIQAALQHHQAGRLAEAEAGYRKILAAHPNEPTALDLLGVLFGATGRQAVGIELIQRACAIAPQTVLFFVHLGNLLRETGKSEPAAAAFARAIQLYPNSAEIHTNYGNALIDLGRMNEAIEAYRTAVRYDARLDKAWSNLGVALRATGKTAEAIVALRKATELAPNSAIAYDNLGIALREDDQLDASLDAHTRSVQINPNSSAALSNYAIALRLKGRHDESIAACRRAIELDPRSAHAWNNLGVAQAEVDRMDEAIASYRKAIEISPGFGNAWSNLGVSLGDKGAFEESAVACRKAVETTPDDPIARLNYGVILLKLGQFEHGWVEYEWRWKCKGLYQPRPFPHPRWNGEQLHGKTLLIHADQGLGDTIQFIRYAPLAAQRGARVILGCDAPLRRLLECMPCLQNITTDGELVPPFDVHCSVVSLPAIFQTTLATIPAQVPYLTAKPRLAEEWATRLAPYAGKVKIGLAWAGRGVHPNDKNRSLSLARLAPLAMDGATFFSLQKGPPASQAANPPSGMQLIDLTAELFDMADTAGLVANLDLVISVDTSLVHLAGAMGKPVWTLVPFNPDWRWLLRREDSPWYPTMRLFRQPSLGEWDEVMLRVRQALREFIAARG